MSAAARTVARDISRQTDALSGSVANTLALKAASEGLGDKYAPVIASLQNLERSSAAAKKESVALFGASEAAATAYYSKLDALVALAETAGCRRRAGSRLSATRCSRQLTRQCGHRQCKTAAST